MFEELLALGYKDAEYDVFIKIEGEQFSSGFVSVNPNSKYRPYLMSVPSHRHVFNLAFILVYLAEKFGEFCLMTQRKGQSMSGYSGNGQRTILGWRVWAFLPYAPEKLST